MDKILRIDMSADGGPRANETSIGDYAGLGGRALTSAMVSKEVPPLCHPERDDRRESRRDLGGGVLRIELHPTPQIPRRAFGARSE